MVRIQKSRFRNKNSHMEKMQLTCCTMEGSAVKIQGNSPVTDVPTIPNNDPKITPIIKRDFSSVWACLMLQAFQNAPGEHEIQTNFARNFMMLIICNISLKIVHNIESSQGLYTKNKAQLHGNGLTVIELICRMQSLQHEQKMDITNLQQTSVKPIHQLRHK